MSKDDVNLVKAKAGGREARPYAHPPSCKKSCATINEALYKHKTPPLETGVLGQVGSHQPLFVVCRVVHELPAVLCFQDKPVSPDDVSRGPCNI